MFEALVNDIEYNGAMIKATMEEFMEETVEKTMGGKPWRKP